MVTATKKPRAPRKPGPTKKQLEKMQASFNDVFIEDKDIAAKLKIIADNEAAAKAYRDAQREVKLLVAAGYEEAINSDRDGEHSGFVVCGQYRFLAQQKQTPERTTVAKTIPSRTNWAPLMVHATDLFSAAAGD